MTNKTSGKTFDVKVTGSRQKNKNFAVERPAHYLIEAEGLTFGKNKPHHRNQRGRLPLVIPKNMESLQMIFFELRSKTPQ